MNEKQIEESDQLARGFIRIRLRTVIRDVRDRRDERDAWLVYLVEPPLRASNNSSRVCLLLSLDAAWVGPYPRSSNDHRFIVEALRA
jgi:hypothetical protein